MEEKGLNLFAIFSLFTILSFKAFVEHANVYQIIRHNVRMLFWIGIQLWVGVTSGM